MHKTLIVETFYNDQKQNFYYLMVPNIKDNGFYRQVSSYNAFFSSIRNPKANVTEIRQFTSSVDLDIEIKHHKKFRQDVDWDNLKTFASIWEFFEFIGYDRKTRKYKSGEVKKVFNGRYFVLPKTKKNSTKREKQNPKQ